MCKVDIKNGDTRIDPCMRVLIKNLKSLLPKDRKIVACCCGHGKYPMTIVIRNTVGEKKEGVVNVYSKDYFIAWDLVSGVEIPRIKRFYKRDKQRIYYIPETIKNKKETRICNK